MQAGIQQKDDKEQVEVEEKKSKKNKWRWIGSASNCTEIVEIGLLLLLENRQTKLELS